MATTVDVLTYYREPAVRAAILEYAGASGDGPATAVYLAGLCPDTRDLPSWERTAVRVQPDEIDRLTSRSCDIARSLWDRTHLIFFLELDYQNLDHPAEPYLRPAEAFFKLEPAYRAATRLFRQLRLGVRSIVTGRGYHFHGRIPLDHPLIRDLAALVPEAPPWLASLPARSSSAFSASLSEVHARAAAGLGLLLEFAAHLISRAAAPTTRIPVVLNGTVVGSGRVGRECVSIDFSHVGDPLDMRHMRVAFSTYQWQSMRPDLFGRLDDKGVGPLVAVPRAGRSLTSLLTSTRDMNAALEMASRHAVSLPDIARGLGQLLEEYRGSTLAAFHREFLAALPGAPPAVDLGALPPCLRVSLTYPNDLLLKPEHIQHLVRGLLARDWRAADIAALVRSKYEEPHEWGDRWTRLDARTRAEFDVRVFAGMIATGLDSLVDFNCVSAQEKDICPRAGCAYDLRRDRDHLSARRPS